MVSVCMQMVGAAPCQRGTRFISHDEECEALVHLEVEGVAADGEVNFELVVGQRSRKVNPTALKLPMTLGSVCSAGTVVLRATKLYTSGILTCSRHTCMYDSVCTGACTG